MQINREIVDDCLSGKPPQEWRQQWVFHAIVEGRYLVEEVAPARHAALRQAADLLEQQLAGFCPLNRRLWDLLLPAWPAITATRTVFLVAGCPAPYDAMTRVSPLGTEVLLFDLNRLLTYTEDPQRLTPLLRAMLTHECAHTCLHRDYPVPPETAAYHDRLQYLCFDEGLAHFLSFQEDIAAVNWNGDAFPQRRAGARARLQEAVRCDTGERQAAFLEQADTGASFWEKFGAIAGMFAWADAFGADAMAALYRRGPQGFLPAFFRDTVR